MRAKIASRAKGHVFEDRFMKLDGLKLIIAYRQALKEEKQEFENTGEIFQAAFKRLEDNFKALFMFTNPNLWAQLKQEEDLQVMREDINEHNFDEKWAEMMSIAPAIVTVQENIPDAKNSSLPKVDKKTQDIITGFLPKRKIQPEEGG